MQFHSPSLIQHVLTLEKELVLGERFQPVIGPTCTRPILEAASEGNLAVLDFIFSQPEFQESVAAKKGFLGLGMCKTREAAERMLRAGVDPNEVMPIKHKLVYAICSVGRMTHQPGPADTLKVGPPLGGLNISAQSKAEGGLAHFQGATALHMAAMRGNVSVAEALLASGADPNRRTRLGLTPRQVAEEYGYRQFCELLEKAENAAARS